MRIVRGAPLWAYPSGRSSSCISINPVYNTSSATWLTIKRVCHVPNSSIQDSNLPRYGPLGCPVALHQPLHLDQGCTWILDKDSRVRRAAPWVFVRLPPTPAPGTRLHLNPLPGFLCIEGGPWVDRKMLRKVLLIGILLLLNHCCNLMKYI